MELLIDPEFKNLIPPMKPEEFQGLIESITKYGYDDLYPIVVWNNTIIDGHNRYLICKELNINYYVSEKEFDDRIKVINWIINNQLNRRSMTNEQRNYLIGKRYKEEKKDEYRPKIKEDVVSLITMKPFDGILEQKIAKKYQVSPNAVRKAEKFADAIDEVANNANINPYKILGREIKGTRKDILELSQKPAELQKEIIEKIEKKEVPNIKTALKEIEDEVIFDEIEGYSEINLKENEYSSPYDLAEKIFGLINNYKKDYDDIDLDFIKNTLEIVNKHLNERVVMRNRNVKNS